MEKTGVTGGFRQRPGVAANNRTTAGLRFDDRPSEAFETRRIQKGDGAIVKRLQDFAWRIGDLRKAIGDAERCGKRTQLRGENVSRKHKPALPLVFGQRKNTQHAFAILAPQIRADVQDEWKIDIDFWNLCQTDARIFRLNFRYG